MTESGSGDIQGTLTHSLPTKIIPVARSGELDGTLTAIEVDPPFDNTDTGFESTDVDSAVLEARFIRRLIDYNLRIPTGYTMLHHGTQLGPTGSLVLGQDAEILIL